MHQGAWGGRVRSASRCTASAPAGAPAGASLGLPQVTLQGTIR